MNDLGIEQRHMPLVRLLRKSFALPTEAALTFSQHEWQKAFDDARKQALVGVLWPYVSSLQEKERPPRDVLLRWYAMAEQIKVMNERVNAAAIDVVKTFAANGFRSAVLKGQGLALLYPHPELRNPGDVDLWVEGERKQVLKYVRKVCPKGEVRYHHVDYPPVNGVEVEVHFTPSWMNSCLSNAKLQRFFKQQSALQFEHFELLRNGSGATLPVPTESFNAVYVLIHIYRHLLGEGIGLRQVMDYYYVVKSLPVDKREQVVAHLESLNLTSFAKALMYVLQQLFGLSPNYFIVPPNKYSGRFVMDEILRSGNFGKYDERLKRKANETALYRFMRSLHRNVRFVRYFPTETLCDPLFKLWQFTWQHLHRYRRKN